MAQATVIRFSKFRVLIGDGASPEVFAAPCGFSARALNLSKTLSEVDIPDCSDEDAASWVGRDVRSLSWSVTGEGVLTQESYETWKDAFMSTSPVMVRIEVELPSGTITYEGQAHLSTFNHSGTRGEKVTVNVEMQGDGALTEV